jgi:hypothetical protein
MDKDFFELAVNAIRETATPFESCMLHDLIMNVPSNVVDRALFFNICVKAFDRYRRVGGLCTVIG